jgi:hypothetical protein
VSNKESYICNGGNYSILLQSDWMILRPKAWLKRSMHKIPLRDIRSVIVERKSVIPFATLTVISIIAAIVLRFNAFWFVVDLSPNSRIKVLANLAVLILVAPTLLRLLFVNVVISSITNESWRIRLVSTRSGKRLVTKFHELSGSQM